MLKDCKGAANVMVPVTIISSCVLFGVLFYQLCLTPSNESTSVASWKGNSEDKGLFRLFRRNADQFEGLEHLRQCIVAEPSGKDVQKLCANQECHTVHCFLPCDCKRGCHSSENTTCFIKACTVFGVTFTKNGRTRTEQKISLKQLSNIVGNYKERAGGITIKCADTNSHLFQKNLDLELTQDRSENCLSQVVPKNRDVEADKDHQKINPSLNVHLIYFRFLSRWESYFKLPQTNSFIEHKRQDLRWKIHNFENVQSQSLGLNNNIHSLLRGRFHSAKGNISQQASDLIQLATDKGRCVMFNYIACHKVKIYEELLNDTTSEANAKNCRFHVDKHISQTAFSEVNNHTFCDDDNRGEMDMEDALYIDDHLSHIYSKTTETMFSLSIINILDLPSPLAFDSSMVKVIADILSRQSSVLILLSDVGDPKFTRIDESVFLRTQTFNPLLHVFVPASMDTADNPLPLTDTLASSMSDPNVHLISILDVYNLTKALIQSQKEIKDSAEARNEHRINTGRTDSAVNARSSGVCPAEEMKGPVECLCLGNHVRFSNDSIQAAFATFVVGSINDKLSDLSSAYREKMGKLSSSKSVNHEQLTQLLRNSPNCDRVAGHSFGNVQHVIWQNLTFVLMTLYLQQATRTYSDLIRVDAEIKYSTDDDYNTTISVHIINPLQIDVNAIVDLNNRNSQKLLHHLCRQPNDLSVKFASDAEFLNSTVSQGHFRGNTRYRSLHHPCLYSVTTVFSDSAVIEAVNVCTDRSYNLIVNAELLNVVSLSRLPVEVTVRPRDVRFITSLVKSAYGPRKIAYKMKPTYNIVWST